MYQRRLARLLLRPSIFSLILTIILTATILGISIWPETASSPLVHQYLYGPYGAVIALQKSADIAHFTTAFSVSPLTYSLFILVVAGLIAAGVYASLQLFGKIVVGSYDTWHALASAGSSVKSVKKEITTKILVRLLALLLWIAFLFFFINVMLPYVIFIARAGVAQFLNWGILYILAAFIVLLVTMHIHVIFLRLLLLRPRVFGGKLAVLQAIYDTDNHMK